MNLRRSALCLALSLVAACGTTAPAEPVAPSILVQPIDQAVAPGQSTTFAVEVDAGSLRTTYQWFWNGASVPSATGRTVTTRPAEVVDNGSTFTVVATNSLGSVTSRAATLTVSPVPRAPKPGDLRFQGVDAYVSRNPFLGSNFLSFMWQEFGGVYGTPLGLSDESCPGAPGGTCGWEYFVAENPEGSQREDVLYTGGVADALDQELDGMARPDAVVTSLDIHELNGSFAAARRRIDGGSGFGANRLRVPMADVAATVAAEGAAGRVVTALSTYAGGMYVLSYSWTQDPATTYETAVKVSAVSAVPASAAELSDAGYIITAFGRAGGGEYVLVGTRVLGDTAPRPLQVWTSMKEAFGLLRGYAVVAYYWDGTVGSELTWIAQQ